MKRSPLPKRRTPLKRSTKPIARKKRPNVKRSKPRRVSVERKPEYLRWLRENCMCIFCVAQSKAGETVTREWLHEIVDPAHTSNNGRGSRGPDSGCVPLCRAHHSEQHRIGVKDFEAKYGVDLKREAETHYSVFTIWKENES